MPRILVTPSHLYNAAKRCRTQAEGLRALVHSLSRKIYNLETIGQQSQALNPVLDKWAAAQRRFLFTVGELEDLANTLELHAQSFEEADQTSITAITALQPQISYITGITSAWWAEAGPVFAFPTERLRVWSTFQAPGIWEPSS